MKVKSRLSNHIANACFVCAIMVVCIHLGESTAASTTRMCHALFGSGICTIAVPFFFIVSGFLLGCSSEVYLKIICKRFRTLIVPYLLWSAMAVVFYAVLSAVGNLHNGRHLLSGIDLTVRGILSGMGLWGNGFVDAPSLGALWYVRALFLFVVTFPVCRWFVRRFVWFGIAAFWCVAVLFAWLSPGVHYLWRQFFTWTFPLSGLVYFATGLLLSEKPISTAVARRLALIAFPIGLAVWAYMLVMAWRGVIVTTAWRLVLVPGLIGMFWLCIPSQPWPKTLTSLSFPLYITHYFFAIIYWFYLPESVNSSLLMYVVKFVISLVGSVAIILALKHLMPRACAIAFGGRG